VQGNPKHHMFDASEARISYFEWGDADAPTILLVHATGFHARLWDKVVAALPEGFRVIAIELRGHGRSEYEKPLESWRIIAQDIRELIQALSLRDLIGVGHSMGAHCMAQTAFDLPEAFKRIVLIDPVLSRPDIYEQNRYADLAGPEEHPIANRRNQWASWQEMFETYKDRHPYSLWQPDVLEDYCRYGLLPRDDGDGFKLACAPLVEASVYFYQRHTNIYPQIAQIETPTIVLRAKRRTEEEWKVTNFTKSPTWEELAAQFKNGRDVYLPDFSHFIPMQDPALVAHYIANDDTRPVIPKG
jgi:pimeloyl-ACP methyl ester carboxylesterase